MAAPLEAWRRTAGLPSNPQGEHQKLKLNPSTRRPVESGMNGAPLTSIRGEGLPACAVRRWPYYGEEFPTSRGLARPASPPSANCALS
jgi:hypothetical protein